MTLRWSVPPGEAKPIVSALQGLMALTRIEPGCAGCSVSSEMGSTTVVQYVEDWLTEEDLKRQLRSQRFSRLAELMERASAHPTVKFALPGRIRGLDYAEEVRRNISDN
jgi:quinol monooxygenase YgiN